MLRYFVGLSPEIELGAIALQWFEVMRKCGDEVRELLHDGCPVACLGDAPFDTAYSDIKERLENG
jgi:hypothetical protein